MHSHKEKIGDCPKRRAIQSREEDNLTRGAVDCPQDFF